MTLQNFSVRKFRNWSLLTNFAYSAMKKRPAHTGRSLCLEFDDMFKKTFFLFFALHLAVAIRECMATCYGCWSGD